MCVGEGVGLSQSPAGLGYTVAQSHIAEAGFRINAHCLPAALTGPPHQPYIPFLVPESEGQVH